MKAFAALLGFSRAEARAFRLLAAWEGTTLVDYARYAIIPVMESSYDDMSMMATGRPDQQPDRAEAAWARRFYPQLRRIMPGVLAKDQRGAI